MIAEGIETPSQMTMVQEMGCEMAQGFLLGRPSPAEVLESIAWPQLTSAQTPGRPPVGSHTV